MSRPLIVLWVCVLFLIAVAPVAAQDCLDPVGRWPYGLTIAAAVAGDHVYFGSGAVLMIADLSDPAAPRVVGDVALPPYPVQRVAFAGS